MTATTNALCQMLLVSLDCQCNASLGELDRVTRRVSGHRFISRFSLCCVLCEFFCCFFLVSVMCLFPMFRGGSRGRPLKLEKLWYFGVKSWFFTRNTPKMFAPPSARRNFFKCAPLTWNPGSALACWLCPCIVYSFLSIRCSNVYLVNIL